MMIVNHAGELHLSDAGEADEVGTKTESSTLASRYTDGRRDQVKHSKDGRRNERERGDFVKRELVTRDKYSGTRNNEALD